MSGERERTVGRFAENKTLWMDQRAMETLIFKVCMVTPLQMGHNAATHLFSAAHVKFKSFLLGAGHELVCKTSSEVLACQHLSSSIVILYYIR